MRDVNVGKIGAVGWLMVLKFFLIHAWSLWPVGLWTKHHQDLPTVSTTICTPATTPSGTVAASTLAVVVYVWFLPVVPAFRLVSAGVNSCK